MRNHPRTLGREALGAVWAVEGRAGDPTLAAAATGAPGTVGRFTGAVGAAFINAMGGPGGAVQGSEARKTNRNARRSRAAGRTRFGFLIGVQRSLGVKRPTTVTAVLVERHFSIRSRARAAGRSPPSVGHRSGARGTSMEPSRCLTGPSAFGIRSHSNMSVGSQSVAQAFGMSTTPEIWPWQGAVPRMA